MPHTIAPGCAAGKAIAQAMIDPDFLIRAYSVGIFPMAVREGEIAWFSPDPRGIIPLDNFHIPHGLKRTLRRRPFETRINTSFPSVISACADRPETWIDQNVIESFCRLHELGYAHSVESWIDGELVGGLYGVSIGSAFFGESMFSRESGSSQSALVQLVHRMRARGFLLLDTQWTNPHLRRFGAVDIPKSQYFQLLRKALGRENSFFP